MKDCAIVDASPFQHLADHMESYTQEKFSVMG